MAKITINDFARKAYKAYIEAGLTVEGACALMGNQYAESAGFVANRVEFLLIRRYKEDGKTYTDKSYTAAVDGGSISRKEFLNPRGKQYGFGLCQWTSPNRKAALYDLARQRGVSIADEQLQIDYTLQELNTAYKSVMHVLKTAQTVKYASDYVLVHFESPADCGAAVKNTRADYAQQYYDYFNQEDENMGATVKEILDIARSYIGCKESDGSHKKIIDLYNSHKPLARGYAVQYKDAWCDTFVSAVAIKAGAVGLIGTECGCEEHVNIFKDKGIWIEDGRITPQPGDIIMYNWDDNTQPNDGYSDHIGFVEKVSGEINKGIWIEDGRITPQPGDIIMYNWDDNTQPNDGYSDHIGFVEKVSGEIITVIEGNYKNAVGRRTISVGHGNIRGYARPKYASELSAPTQSNSELIGSCKVEMKTFLKGAVDPQIKIIQMILKKLKYKGKDGQKLEIDGSLGENTAYAIEHFQRDHGLEGINYGTVAKKTWKLLLNAL